jgi:hypothetical protein
MTAIIDDLKTSFNMYLNSCDVKLTNDQLGELSEFFNKSNEHYVKNAIWCSPELLEAKAMTSIYTFIPYIKDNILNELLRVFWNRYATRCYFKNKFKFSKMSDPFMFYEEYANEKLKKRYNKEYDYLYDFLMKKINELKIDEKHIKPFIVNLIEDDNYNFITQKSFKLYLIRSNNTISTHVNNIVFTKYSIDFYDEKNKMICTKGIIWGLV